MPNVRASDRIGPPRVGTIRNRSEGIPPAPRVPPTGKPKSGR